MLRIDVTLPLNFTENDIKSKILSVFPVAESDVLESELLKLTLDLGDRAEIRYKAAIGVCFADELEEKFKLRRKVCSVVPSLKFEYERYDTELLRPVVVGAGPCGLFAALTLAEAGARPVVLERGLPVDERQKKVEGFLKLGALDPECNIQFGEGGAGTYSDGKLKSGSLNKYKYKILKDFIEAGATDDIIYSSTAHLGTDKLSSIVKSIREKIIRHGGSFVFGARFCGVIREGGRLTGVTYEKDGRKEKLPATDVVLAIGHSARDTIASLYESGILMEQKSFGIGMRIEHPREYINGLVYGKGYNASLETASYHLVTHLKGGRSVYSFCMCPGGTVVPAASERGCTVTNGMSEFARDADNSNSALLVSVTPADFGSSSPLAGIEFQRRIESRAFELMGGTYVAPSAKMGEIKENIAPCGVYGAVKPSYALGVSPADPSGYLPSFVAPSLREAFDDFDEWMPGFYMPDAVLSGPETRTTSPIRMLRDERTREAIGNPNIYPSGEGAGYAGGIVTSAYDGMLTSLSILEKFKK